MHYFYKYILYMKTSLILFTLAFSSLSLLASANLAGISMAVDIDVINKMKNYAMPMIMADLNSMDVGKIEFDGGYVDNIAFNFEIKDFNSIQVALSGADKAIKMSARDISGYLSGKFSYKFLFITASGNFKVTL